MKIIKKLLEILKRISKINLLIEPNIRYYWVVTRAFFLIIIGRRLRSLSGENTVKLNYMHNVKAIFGCDNRMNLLIFPLSVIETISRESKILVIGPRNENDIYSLIGLGFKKENIKGLDLISYSRMITLGDMHAAPFEDDSFDAVICGWTISYSTNPSLAALEMLRLTRRGGVIAVAVEYSTLTEKDEEHLVGYNLQEFDLLPSRVNSSEQILELFGDRVETVFFKHDAPNKISHSVDGLVPNVSSVAVIFESN